MATSRWTNLAVLGAVLLAAVGFAGPASADPVGLVKVGVTSAASSVDKTLTALCPAGKVVTGGGGYLTAPGGPHQGHVALDRLEPLDNGSGFTAAMREVDAHPLAWQLSTDALCVPEPAGWDVVSATGPLNTQVVTRSCGTKSVIGVGGRINNGFGDVVLDYVVPSADLKSVTVRGTPVAGKFPTNWSVTAFAVCAYDDEPERVALITPPASNPHVAMNWSCPAGTGLYSIGATISPGSGQVFLSLVHAISVDSFSAAADEDASGYPFNWTLAVYGICGP